MRRLWRSVRWFFSLRIVKWPLAAVAALLVGSCLPIAYVELACRGDEPAAARAYGSLIEPQFRRPEANSYLTYPEWHIVFVYDGLAQTLESGDEHAYGYLSSIGGFWRSTCALMRAADEHGGADGPTRTMIHTIGVSFTIEMILKGLYEQTVGRATAWVRGPAKTPQDEAIARMAVDYAAFLRQTPWYAYPFPREARALWTPPAGLSLRAWERRLGIGMELLAKAGYARLIGGAAAAGDAAKLEIRSIVSGLDRPALAAIPDVAVVGERPEGLEIETPRYAKFTRILFEIARRGGGIVEIAGNDDVMMTMTVPTGADVRPAAGSVILRLPRSGFASDRVVLDVPVRELASLLRTHSLGDPGVEHVFDY
jgi:hypothetical protein